MKQFIFSLAVSISMMMTSCTKQPGNTPPNLPGGLVTTLVGPSFQITNGTGTAASFNSPQGVAVDVLGNVYVADYGNNMIRMISPSGIVSTLAGSETKGSVNGTGTAASFNHPSGVAVDAFGNVYVADYGNNMIRMISTSESSYGVVTTVAGDPTGASGSANGNGTAASFFDPAGVAVDAAGNVYVADEGNNLIRKITTTGPSVGVVSTLAGASSLGSAGGATFNSPAGVVVDAAGNVYVADAGSDRILKISQSGIPMGLVTTLAGSGTGGLANGTGTAAAFNYPTGVALDEMGNVYVADLGNNLIREISPSGV